jgi:hypothetical protein
MTDVEILRALFRNLAAVVHRTLEGVSPDALRWQPDQEANNIAVTVWHFSRAFDIFKVRLFENRSADEEVWCTHGWAAETGYDPRGLGFGGFGNLAGYTQAEVQAVPILSVDDLLAYFDQAFEELSTYLGEMPPGALYQPAAGWPDSQRTVYEWLRNLLADSHEHIGEIKAINAMWERKTRSAESVST